MPPTLTVASGATVTWTNGDNVQHTVTADDGNSFASTALGQGQTFPVHGRRAGDLCLYLPIHPFMNATLTVTAP